MNFRWNEWNVEHIARHGVAPEMAEEVVEGAGSPYPRRIGDDKLLVWGRTEEGQALQVIFVVDVDGSAFVLHARVRSSAARRKSGNRHSWSSPSNMYGHLASVPR